MNYTLLDRYSLSAHRPYRRFEPPGAGTQVGVLPVGRSSRGSSATRRSCSASAGSTRSRCAGATARPATRRSTRIRPQGTLTPRLYTFGTTRVRGYKPGAIPNPDLGWEKTDQTDIGIDYSMLNDRISGSIDGYSAKTHDLLLTRLLPVTSGFTSTLQNIGSTENTRPRGRALDDQPAELARPDLVERLQLDAQQEQDHGARRAARRRTSATSGSSASRSTSDGCPAPRVLRLQVRRRVAVRRLGADEGVQRERHARSRSVIRASPTSTATARSTRTIARSSATAIRRGPAACRTASRTAAATSRRS